MTDKPIPQWIADLSLLMVTAIWGTTFVIVKNAIEQITPMYFLALRFTVAALVLAIFPGTMRGLKGHWQKAMAPGLMLALAYALQTYGLLYTTASRAGFITGLSVILVPVMYSVFRRVRPGAHVMAGALVSTLGLALMSGSSSIPLNAGDIMVLGCAFGFALQIILVGQMAKSVPPLSLTLGMLATAALLFWPGALQELFYHGTAPVPSLSVLSAALATAVFATSLAFYLQCKMQRFTTPSHTALIFSAEPVFAALFAFLLAGEVVGRAGVVGGGLIVSGILLVEIYPMYQSTFSPGTE
jgi:drug/metabolite transporter (DMT)-like permease